MHRGLSWLLWLHLHLLHVLLILHHCLFVGLVHICLVGQLHQRHFLQRLGLEFLGNDLSLQADQVTDVTLDFPLHTLEALGSPLRLDLLRAKCLTSIRGTAHDVANARNLIDYLLAAITLDV